MRSFPFAVLVALVLFGGCNRERPRTVTAPPPTDVRTPPDEPPPRLLLFADPAQREPVASALSHPDVGAAVDRATGFAPDVDRAFAVAGATHGRSVQVTFLPLHSLSDPDELMLIVRLRAGGAEAVRAARVRRAPAADGSFQRHGSLWLSPVDAPAPPGEARWSDDQTADFWNCVIDRSTTNVVSCAIGCVFAVGGWVPCVAGCTTVGELTIIAGCAARVLVNDWRGSYEPKESER